MAEVSTDVIVIGGGAMGTAAGWALARAGHRVAVLEQFGHINAMASHGGETRIFRHAYAEGERYVPWTIEADNAWVELEQRTGTRFLHRHGSLDVSAPGLTRAQRARESAERYSIAHEWIDGAEINRRFPGWSLPPEYEGVYSPNSGLLDVAGSLRALASEMSAAGGVLHEHTPVLGWDVDGPGVRVETRDTLFLADRLIVTAGPWAGTQLRELGLPLEVRRKVAMWFETEDDTIFAPEHFPVHVVETPTDLFYGMPQYQTPGTKAGIHSGGQTVDPDRIVRDVLEEDRQSALGPFMTGNLNRVTGNVLRSVVCMYTMTPDEDFVIDRHPHHAQVVFAAGFSGHGFKFAPVIGQHLAHLVLDPEANAIPDFSLSRFSR